MKWVELPRNDGGDAPSDKRETPSGAQKGQRGSQRLARGSAAGAGTQKTAPQQRAMRTGGITGGHPRWLRLGGADHHGWVQSVRALTW
jgi:hypothetical protein